VVGLFKAICNELSELLAKKRHDYGEPSRTLGRYGVKGIVVRMGDKFERLHGLTWEGKEPNFESLEDTLLDMAGYSVLALELLRDNTPKKVLGTAHGCADCGRAAVFDEQQCHDCLGNGLRYWIMKDDFTTVHGIPREQYQKLIKEIDNENKTTPLHTS
jgi:hypothetical protein